MPKKTRVALLFVCLNSHYWPYLENVIKDCDKFFLTARGTNCEVDYFTWSDMPEETNYGATVFPTDPAPWPMPTLMRYHLFLQQEEKLKDYDYIFYMDADMRVVDSIGRDIFGEGLTMAEHPMYSLARRFIPPYEPNSASTAFIHRLGRVGSDPEGKPLFKPLYAAGGFQGGTASEFLKAMHAMKQSIDKDFANNYVAIWNDESHWNKYLWDYKGPLTVLDVSYVYPDSLIKEYYEPIWGRAYTPKIITLTKPFTLTKQGGDFLKQTLGLNPPPGTPAVSRACPTCGDTFQMPNFIRVVQCNGSGKPHQIEQKQ